MAAEVFGQAGLFVLVSILWGSTNPFIKRASRGITSINKESHFSQFVAEWAYMLSHLDYLIPFLLNQAGSILYFLTLASADLIIAVPLTNSLTIVFTLLSGAWLGEAINTRTCCGMVLVVFGLSLCVLSQQDT